MGGRYSILSPDVSGDSSGSDLFSNTTMVDRIQVMSRGGFRTASR